MFLTFSGPFFVNVGPKQLTKRVLVSCLGPGLTEFSPETLRNGNVVFWGCLLLAGGLLGWVGGGHWVVSLSVRPLGA